MALPYPSVFRVGGIPVVSPLLMISSGGAEGGNGAVDLGALWHSPNKMDGELSS